MLQHGLTLLHRFGQIIFYLLYNIWIFLKIIYLLSYISLLVQLRLSAQTTIYLSPVNYLSFLCFLIPPQNLVIDVLLEFHTDSFDDYESLFIYSLFYISMDLFVS
jgi:hypothetical protein